MIIEPKLTPEDYEQIVKAASYRDKGGIISCGHDFWERAKTMEYGDIILCTRCWQYYAKIRHLPWVVKPRTYFTKGLKEISFVSDFKTNHLSDNWFVQVPVRVTN